MYIVILTTANGHIVAMVLPVVDHCMACELPGRLRNLAERMTGDIGILASWRVFERSSPYQIYVEIFADLLGVRITPEKEILSRRLLSGADYTFKAS